MKIQEKKAQKNSANKTLVKDRNTLNQFFLEKETKSSEEEEGQNKKIIKWYTLNSGNAKRDDKIVSTVKDRGGIQ